MEATIDAVSTRLPGRRPACRRHLVDSHVAAPCAESGIAKSQVNRISQEIDARVQAFLSRPLESSGYTYVYLDATDLKGRLGKAQQFCSRDVVVAMVPTVKVCRTPCQR
jgi:hypothetical protein